MVTASTVTYVKVSNSAVSDRKERQGNLTFLFKKGFDYIYMFSLPAFRLLVSVVD